MTARQYNHLLANARKTKGVRAGRQIRVDRRLTGLLDRAVQVYAQREEALKQLVAALPAEFAGEILGASFDRGVLRLGVPGPALAARLRPVVQRLARELNLRVRLEVQAKRRPARPVAAPPPRTRIVGRRRVPAATALF
jgi:hypothetical protein